MLLQAFNRAIIVANNVDHNRLAEDAAYRQRVVDMLQCEKPAGPSLISRGKNSGMFSPTTNFSDIRLFGGQSITFSYEADDDLDGLYSELVLLNF